MNNDEQKELLRLTAIALGDGWKATGEGDLLFKRDFHSPRDGTVFLDPFGDDADSRWLECELMMNLGHTDEKVYADSFDGQQWATIYMQDHNNDRHKATRWAVLKCAAEIGKAKEGEE